tara:strand:+ start:55376 stop:55918 length:543 start_codon:yes stop_codon:yes gene_type:complete
MKKVILLIVLAVAPLVSYGQSIFDKLEDMEGVSSVVVSKDAFEILSKFNVNIEGGENNEAMEVFKMIQDLNELKVFSTDKSDIAATMESMVKSAVKSQNLIELMRLKEDDSRVLIYVKSGKNKDFVNEVLMFVKGIDKRTDGMSEAVVVSLTGSIDINKMSKLADTFTKSNKIKVKTNKK